MAIGSFMVLPLMLEKLGQNTFGIWMVISSSVGLMGFLDLGLGSALMNYIAFNSDRKADVVKFIKTAYMIQFCFIGILLIVLQLSFAHIPWDGILNIRQPGANVLRAVAITVTCFLVNLVTSTIYAIQKGLQKSYTANAWLLAGTIIYLLLLWLVLMKNPALEWIALVNFGVPVVVSLVNSVLFLYKEQVFSQAFISRNISWREMKLFTGDSALLLFLQLAAMICFQTDCLILAHYTTYAGVAQFTVAAKIFAIPMVILGVYLQSLWPAYAKAFSDGNWAWIKRVFLNSLFFAFLGAVIFVAAIGLSKDLLVKYWLSGQMQISAALLAAFGLWAVVNSIDSNIATLLNGLKKLKLQAFWALIMVMANLTFSILLVKSYGVPGVIWGTVLSTTLCSVIPCAVYIKHLYNVNIKLKAAN
ncbi:lipopolysaccharide biosynthesis protein [Hufsiella ginkgonis]|uniref:Oligosaccharide flippase family protein n=1 Tax=Hufsiella ginkgonis TaxID=2695274 RepID=A0A7K1XTF8_9SPHI|nr:hypothetical protein [Hufsiella ginkgonis]MXV14242.1 hypothetical protein [Hufsiella ginkgonis]